MATSSDGILEAVFDTEQNVVRLIVDGGMWPDVVNAVTITRAVTGAATVPVRAVRTLSGGWVLTSDNEAPMGQDVTYTARGTYDGAEVATTSVTVSTTGAVWGLWLKSPGNAALTVLAKWAEVGEYSTPTQGSVYQVPGGGAVPQWAGVETAQVPVTVSATTQQEAAALEGLLAQQRVLLVQVDPTQHPEEIPSGYWFVSSVSRANPAQLTADLQALRTYQLQLTWSPTPPAGEGVGGTGVTYAVVLSQNATYQELLDDHATYLDVLLGG